MKRTYALVNRYGIAATAVAAFVGLLKAGHGKPRRNREADAFAARLQRDHR